MYRGAAGQDGATSMRKAQERRGLHDETGDSETITGQAQRKTEGGGQVCTVWGRPEAGTYIMPGMYGKTGEI